MADSIAFPAMGRDSRTDQREPRPRARPAAARRSPVARARSSPRSVRIGLRLLVDRREQLRQSLVVLARDRLDLLVELREERAPLLHGRVERPAALVDLGDALLRGLLLG